MWDVNSPLTPGCSRNTVFSLAVGSVGADIISVRQQGNWAGLTGTLGKVECFQRWQKVFGDSARLEV